MNVTTPALRHVPQTTQHQSARYSKGLQARKIFISASENIFYGDNNNNWRTFHYFLVAFCPRHGRNSVMSAGTTVADRDPRWLCSRGRCRDWRELISVNGRLFSPQLIALLQPRGAAEEVQYLHTSHLGFCADKL